MSGSPAPVVQGGLRRAGLNIPPRARGVIALIRGTEDGSNAFVDLLHIDRDFAMNDAVLFGRSSSEPFARDRRNGLNRLNDLNVLNHGPSRS